MEQRVEIGVDWEGLSRDLQAVAPDEGDMQALATSKPPHLELPPGASFDPDPQG